MYSLNTATGGSGGSWYLQATTGSNHKWAKPTLWGGATGAAAPGTSSQGAHTHTISGSTGSADNRPAYATIVICKKD